MKRNLINKLSGVDDELKSTQVKDASVVRQVFFVASLTLLMILAGVVSMPHQAYAAQDRTMRDGETLDLSSISDATNLHIATGGDYYFKGSTNKTLLYVDAPAGSTATIHFIADTTISATSQAPGSSKDSRSAITVADTGGEVILESSPGTKTVLSGKGNMPALRKDGTSTALRFRTMDPANAGTISVSADSSASRTCAIGCWGTYYGMQQTNVTGNIHFESGSIEAYGSSGSYVLLRGPGGGPAIGASVNGDVDGLYFTGASVKAVAGDPSAAAIGTSSSYIEWLGEMNNTARNIYITGGSVSATQKDGGDPRTKGGGAAIGGGQACSAVGIYISGGTVVADASLNGGGAGIGGGYNGDGIGIVISGGVVEATAAGHGIGGGGAYNTYEDTRFAGEVDVTISGGDVTARSVGSGAGIGGSKIGWGKNEGKGRIAITGGVVHAYGSPYGSGIGTSAGSQAGTIASISISGGSVYAQGGQYGLGIGSYPHAAAEYDGSFGRVKAIEISGGTVEAVGGPDAVASIGGYSSFSLVVSQRQITPVYISGGNVRAEKDLFKVAAKQSADGPDLTLKKVNIESFDDKASDAEGCVSELIVKTAAGSANYQYGINDLREFDQGASFDLWLPEDAWVAGLGTIDLYTNRKDAFFTGMYEKEVSTVYPMVRLNVKAGYGSGIDRTGAIYYGESLASSFTPHVRPGYVLKGYSVDAAGGVMLLNNGNELLPSVAGYTDASGHFIEKPTKDWYQNGLTVYAQWEVITYHIEFDVNVPQDASTTSRGAMDPIEVNYDESTTLPSNGFALPGYSFAGWNTSRDGSGTAYADGASIKNISSSADVVLYAQWTPLEYTVHFDAGRGTGAMNPLIMRFDTPANLPPCGYTQAGKRFVGWTSLALGSLYNDEQTVYNLCALNAYGAPVGRTLVAQWIEPGSGLISISNDDMPVTTVDPATIELYQSGTTYGDCFEAAAYGGFYKLKDDAAIPFGVYEVRVAGYDTTGKTMTLQEGLPGFVVLDYATVEIASDDHVKASILVEGTPTVKCEKVPIGASLSISSQVDEGYAFERYTAQEHDPIWTLTAESPQQDVVVTGKTLIEAHAAPVLYSAVFDANGGEGDMQSQDFVYDEPQSLLANSFTRAGYTFAGWTLTPTWTGKLYTDGESVQGLSAISGGRVTLYAQWTPDEYFVSFNSNGASGFMLDQAMFVDISSPLSANEFTNVGFRFAGWNTKHDGSGTTFANEEAVTNIYEGSSTASPILYAQWVRAVYTVSFDANGGLGTMSDEEVWSGIAYPLSSCAFLRDGYTFAGWNTKPDGSGDAYADRASVIDIAEAGGSVVLYAQWKIGGTPDNPVPSDESGSPDAKPLARTGDDLQPYAWLLACLAGLAGLCIAVWKPKRQ